MTAESKNVDESSETGQGFVKLELSDGAIELPLVCGTEGEWGIDIGGLRARTGLITLDEGFVNTGACRSAITYIDGEQGILRYRGYPIEEIAARTTFPEVALLLINGDSPTLQQRADFSELLTAHALLHEGLRHHFEGFPPDAHPMAILSAMINAISCYHPDLLQIADGENLMDATAKLLSKVRTIAAFSYKKSRGEPIVYPDPHRDYCNNFLHMMFSLPFDSHEPLDEAVRALRLFFILHADHEQNCSTATARMVGSTGANLFASVAAAVCALWGPLHGGANSAVVRMLQRIHQGEETVQSLVEKVKRKEALLWGFGHRVYKNFDPRVRLLKDACDELLEALGTTDPLLGIAAELEEVAVRDEYFVQRKLYPNVDFYSGILLKALGIPLAMFPVMFAIGRMPGWIAHWIEAWRDGSRLNRPRQIYTGPGLRQFVPIDRRKL